jgi:CHAT domain-containing protein/tetratricopeptide (TPR) repeat protein
MRHNLLLSFFFLCVNALAQPAISPTLDSNQAIKAGARAFQLNEYQQAANLFAQAANAYRLQGNFAGEVQANTALGMTMAKTGKISAALQLLQQQADITNKKTDLAYLELDILEKICILYTNEPQSIAKINALQAAYRALTREKGAKYDYYLGSFKNMEGLLSVQQKDSKKAILLYTESVGAFQKSTVQNKNMKIGLVYNNMGAVYEQQSDWLNAQNYYQRAYAIALKNEQHSSLIAMSLYNMAYPMEEQGKYEEALAAYKKVLAAYAKTNKRQGKDESDVYIAMAGCYLQLRNFAQARLYAQRSLTISTQITAIDKTQIDYINILTANQVFAEAAEGENQPQKALTYLNIAEKSANNAHDDDALSDVLRMKARLFSNYPALGNAEQTFIDLIALNTKLDLPIMVARTQLNLAAYRQKNGKKNYADLLAAAKPVLIKAQKKTNLAVLQALEWTLAPQNNALRLNALNNCLLPNHAIRKIGEPINPSGVLQAEQYLEVIRILSANSSGVEKLYFYENAMQYLVFMRQNIQLETSKLNITALTRQFADAALSEATAQNDANAAFRFIEYAKSLSILEAQQRNEAQQRANLSYDKIQKENDLKAQLFVLQKKLDDDENTNYNDTHTKIAKINDEIEAMQAENQAKPTQKQINNAVLQHELQTALQPNEVFLNYYISEKTLYLVLVEQKKVTLFSNTIENTRLHQQIQDFLATAKQANVAAFAETNIALRNALLHFDTQAAERLLINKKRWIISPDDLLFQLPFELLANENAQNTDAASTNFANFPYLLRQHSIVYQYSAALYLQSKNHEYSIFKRGLLAFAPFTDRSALPNTIRSATTNQGFTALPFSKKEIENLNKNFDAKIFTSKEATKQNFMANASKYGVLHLATHTVYDSTDQAYNLVFLDKTKNQYSFLKNYEIAYSNLAAELVALSACNTANGTIEKGEAAASLARAFAYAGTPNVLTTLWEVPDQANANIIERFYKNLAQGLPKDEALQQAKLQYLATANPQNTYPQMWAGAILIGNAEPLQALQKAWWQTWWLLCLPAVLIMGLLYRFAPLVFGEKRMRNVQNK